MKIPRAPKARESVVQEYFFGPLSNHVFSAENPAQSKALISAVMSRTSKWSAVLCGVGALKLVEFIRCDPSNFLTCCDVDCHSTATFSGDRAREQFVLALLRRQFLKMTAKYCFSVP